MLSASSTSASDSVRTPGEFVIERTWHSDHRTPIRWLLSYMWREWKWFFGIVIGAMGNGLGAVAVPYSLGIAYNAISGESFNAALLLQAVTLIVGSQIVRGILQFLRNYSSNLIGQRLERDMRDELYTSLLGKSMSFHDRQRIGDVMARCTNDVHEIALLMEPGINIVIGSGAFIVSVFIVAPLIYPWLLLVPAGYVVGYIFLVSWYLGKLRPAVENVRLLFGRLNVTLAEAIEGVETVKGAAQENFEETRFSTALSNWRNAAIKQGEIEARFLPGLLYSCTQVAGLLFTLYLYSRGIVTIGAVISFNSLLMTLQFPTFATQFAYPQVASGVASARRMWALINDDSPLDFAANQTNEQRIMRGDVEFRDVSFAYGRDASQNTLNHVSFSIHAGQTVAIVGQTGFGKSTITKLINRIYDPQSGAVLVDGVDAREWDLANLRKQISIIEQDVFLFSRTIAENIAFGTPNTTQAQIENAARAAQAHDFILSFRDGYQTVVGERGVTLSGGQRQRIAIARAFLTDPRILILDDSTSAIDSATEDQIQRAMLRAAQGRTTFIITHRLSQIRWADHIIVINRGRIEAIGTHEEAMRASASYRAIFLNK